MARQSEESGVPPKLSGLALPPPHAPVPKHLQPPDTSKPDDIRTHDRHVLYASDYPQNQTIEIVERLSRSCISLREIVEQAKAVDPKSFKDAVHKVEDQILSSGKNLLACTPILVFLERFHSNSESGLTEEQARINMEEYGPNKLESGDADPAWKIFIYQMKSPVVLLLLVAAIVSLAFQEYAEGIVILIIVILNAALATYMEKSASEALKNLASLAAPKCRVVRGGAEKEIQAVDAVPGDVVLLKMGDSIPADIRMIEVVELKTNEAILTGEPEDIVKTIDPRDPDAPFASNICFASTSVTSGTARGLIITTGMETQVGKIAAQLAKESRKGSNLTPLQRGLNRLGGMIGIMAICVLVLIVIVAVVTKYQDPSHPDADPVLSIILVAVGFAVSSIPEGLPMVVTICLSLGCKDMVKRKANVRKLPAVETLGCCSVVCSDKTGTLTEGKMTAVRVAVLTRGGEELMSQFSACPTKGFDPNGGIFKMNDLSLDAKEQIERIYQRGIFQDFDAVLKDYGNPENKHSIHGAQVRALCLLGGLNSYGTTLAKDPETSKWTTVGNMSEGAIVVIGAKARWSNVTPNGVDPYEQYPRLPSCEVPFNSARKMMITVHKLSVYGRFEGINLDGEFTHVAIVKGAPDFVLPSVKLVLKKTNDESLETPLTVDWENRIGEAEKTALGEVNSSMANSALRVLMFCMIPLLDKDVRMLKSLEDAAQRLDGVMSGPVILVGLMGSVDPARNGVPSAVDTSREAGIRVIMITGDQQTTAAAIAREIRILLPEHTTENNTLVCANLHVDGDPTKPHIEEEQFDNITNRVNVFSRAQPDDKIAIVNSLKRQDHVAAMTGDGVNDAPALQAADIGVAMGIAGTDVAKGAAEMVLMDDNFCTIAAAIEEGRKIYANIQKFVAFLLGTNIGEIIYLTVAICVGMKMPVEALQILFLNLMSDGCPAVALSREPADPGIMKASPRPRKQPIMTKEWWFYGIIPHTIFEAACVLASLSIAMYMCTGAVLLKDIENQCLTHNEQRYLCVSSEYRAFRGFNGWISSMDYIDDTGNLVQWLGFSNSHYSHLGTITPASVGLNLTCPAGADSSGWCLPVEGQDYRGHDYVNVKGSLKATTQSFLTAVYCEMLRAYTVRSWDCFISVFNRNEWMHMACSLSATSTLVLTIIPGVDRIFGVTVLQWWQYAMAISWGFVNLVTDEIIPKPIYRAHRRRKEKQYKTIDEP